MVQELLERLVVRLRGQAAPYLVKELLAVLRVLLGPMPDVLDLGRAEAVGERRLEIVAHPVSERVFLPGAAGRVLASRSRLVSSGIMPQGGPRRQARKEDGGKQQDHAHLPEYKGFSYIWPVGFSAFFLLFPLAPWAAAFWLGPSSESRWAERPIALESIGSELQPRDGDESDGLSYAFANDDKNLYVAITPHTKTAKEQLAGLFGQDLYVWLEPPGKGSRKAGIELVAPERLEEAARPTRLIGLDEKAPGDRLEAAMIPAARKGGVEVRVPLRYFGARPPRKVFVGLEASAPHRTLSRAEPALGSWSGANGQVRDGPRPGDIERVRQDGARKSGEGDGSMDVLQLWVQVTLASPEKR